MKISATFLKYFISCVSLLTLTVQTFASVQAEESHEVIKQVVSTFIEKNIQTNPGERINVDVGYIDSRLSLAPCTIPLEPFSGNSNSSANMIVGVRCEGVQPWKIYVPVRVAIYKKVVVASNPLNKGIPLTADDLRLTEQNTANLTSGFYTEKDALIGKVLTRSVSAGMPLTNAYLENPVLIQRGQMVTLIVKKGELEVTSHGIALNKGRIGDVIAVKNTSSKRVIEGTVMTGQTVEIYVS